ncbi:putative secreted protein (Por secretion system target) [Arcicella aurantiaca]|uniref:Putative secreted protein (Por secretion system target) n=1 Tax=Arcicella aurantiaca TaxID=591202 RepID=A0A316EYJ3_9BACT|nr:T9SS type A sorting domain-containing protein [Arcicella aurantiaca]PWK28370.1 putative secreted protein (Por secretion system target) [Arcicella aurantiaca]
MKKFTLLFATLLAMFGDAFGQKETRLVWEQGLNTRVDSVFYSLMGGISRTSQGEIVVGTDEIRVFSENGKYLLKYSDISQSNVLYSLAQGKKINWSISKEKVILVDKSFKVLVTLDNVEPKSIIEIEDGIFLFTTGKVIKYDFSGRELWQYQLKNKINSFNILDNNEWISGLKSDNIVSNYTLFYHDDNSGKGQRTMIRINGKNVTEMTIDFMPEMTIPTIDKGFWAIDLRVPVMEERVYIKYDSTGKKMFEINPRDIKLGISYVKDTRPVGITPNGSLIFESNGQNASELLFFRVDMTGKAQATERIGIADYTGSAPSKVIALSEDSLLFAGPKYYVTGNVIFGAASFSDNKVNWGKVDKVGSSIGVVGNQFLNQNSEKIESYDLQGQLLWVHRITNYQRFNRLVQSSLYPSYSLYQPYYLSSIYEWKGVEEYIYLREVGFVRKVRVSDGALIWRINQLNEMRLFDEDKDGNSYWINENGNYNKKKKTVFIVSNKGEINKIFESPKEDWNLEGYGSIYERFTISIDIQNKNIYTIPLEEQVDKSLRFFLRKYAYRCLYDLAATAQATGKTEACSGTKVKLSTTKQDGLTYQWQKDGKDIPTFKDTVHDVEESGNYTVTVKDEICQNQATSNAVKVIIKPTPEASISTDIKGVIYEPFKVKMTANIGTGLSYEWYENDTLIANATTAIYEAGKSGTYQVKVSKDGCMKVSEPFKISILIPLANESEVGEEEVLVYPNPVKENDAFHIVLPTSLKNANVQLFDSYGREHTFDYANGQAQITGLQQGVYFLRVSKHDKTVSSKIIIE